MFPFLFFKLIYLLIFIFGLVVGSFLNCVIYRLNSGQSFLKGKSFCPYCHHLLSWQDLIPIFSFLILKGRCRYCHQKISWQYPLVEISTAFLFLLISLKFFTIVNFISIGILLILASFLVVIFVYDLKHYIIPDKIIYSAIVLAFLYQLFRIWNLEFVSNLGFRIWDFLTLINPLISAILAAGFFFMIVLVSRGKWMGMGDVKLAFFMGLFLGWPKILVALFLAFFIGASIGLILIALGKKTLKSEIPFGPFLVTGTFLAVFFGEKIIDFYLNLFLLK